MFDYIKDGINPRGAQYGATARAALAAERDAEASEDLLELELAETFGYRETAAKHIAARRAHDARSRAFWHRVDFIGALLILGGVVWYLSTPTSEAPQSGVNEELAASANSTVENAMRPVIQARALDTTGNNDEDATYARGVHVLHDAGLSDEQINATSH